MSQPKYMKLTFFKIINVQGESTDIQREAWEGEREGHEESLFEAIFLTHCSQYPPNLHVRNDIGG